MERRSRCWGAWLRYLRRLRRAGIYRHIHQFRHPEREASCRGHVERRWSDHEQPQHRGGLWTHVLCGYGHLDPHQRRLAQDRCQRIHRDGRDRWRDYFRHFGTVCHQRDQRSDAYGFLENHRRHRGVERARFLPVISASQQHVHGGDLFEWRFGDDGQFGVDGRARRFGDQQHDALDGHGGGPDRFDEQCDA